MCVREFLCERERACEYIDTSTNGESVRECMCERGRGMSAVDRSTKRAMDLFEVLFLCVHVCVCVFIYTYVYTSTRENMHGILRISTPHTPPR